MIRILLILTSIVIGVSFNASSADAASKYRHCIRISFPGKDHGTITNLCNKNLYAKWVDDRGEHDTAVGKFTSLSIGRINGPFQIIDAMLQNDSVGSQNNEKKESPTRTAFCLENARQCYFACSDEGFERARQCHDTCFAQNLACDASGKKFFLMAGLNSITAPRHSFAVQRGSDDGQTPAAGIAYQPAPMLKYKTQPPAYKPSGCPAGTREILGECR